MSDPIDLQARQRWRAWEKAQRGARVTLVPEAIAPPKRLRGPYTRHYAKPQYRTPLRYVPAPPQRPTPHAAKSAFLADRSTFLAGLRALRSSFSSYCTREQLLDQLDDLLYRHEKAPDH